MSGQHGILSEKKDNRFQKELNRQKKPLYTESLPLRWTHPLAPWLPWYQNFWMSTN